MEADIKILEDYIKLINKGYCDDCNELCNIYGTPAFPSRAISQALENLIKGYRELEIENQSYRDYMGEPPCYDNANYIKKSTLKEFFTSRLEKYQEADDGRYEQDYLTRGELELVDRYGECKEIAKIILEEEIKAEIPQDSIPKSKIKEKIEEINKSHGYSPVNKIFIEQVLQELLEEKQ